MVASQESISDHTEPVNSEFCHKYKERAPDTPTLSPRAFCSHDFEDSGEMLDDPEADLCDSEPQPFSSSRLRKGTKSPSPAIEVPRASVCPATASSSTSSTSTLPPQSSDTDERPSKRAKIDNRVDTSDQSHGIFNFFTTVSKEEWRIATDEEARRNKGKWEDVQKQAAFVKLAKEERSRELAKLRKQAQRAREKTAKAASNAPPVSYRAH